MTIQERKTIRQYQDKDVADDLLCRLLADASRAATMGNMQLYSVVVSRDPDMKGKLAPLHFNQPMVKGAPVVLTVCADYNRFSQWCQLRDAQPGYDNFLSFVNAATDALLFTQALTTLAEEQGLGTCFLGTTLYTAQEIIRLLNLPKLTFPIATITLGYPAENPGQSDRLPVEAFVHRETYAQYTEADINRAYHAKEGLEENRRFVEINHKTTLAQVFTDCRYTKNDNEAISGSLMEALKEQGFL